jgi:hypothetical protein
MGSTCSSSVRRSKAPRSSFFCGAHSPIRVLSSVPSVSSVVIGFSRDSRLRAQTFRPLRLFFALFAVKSFSPRSLRIFAAISALKAFPTTAFETTTTHSVLAIHNSGRPPIPPLQKHRWLVRLSRCQPLFLASRRPPQERSPDLRGHSRHSAKFFLHLAPQFLNSSLTLRFTCRNCFSVAHSAKLYAVRSFAASRANRSRTLASDHPCIATIPAGWSGTCDTDSGHCAQKPAGTPNPETASTRHAKSPHAGS